MAYRFIGPPGNRVSAVVGVPGDSNIAYAGAASGGVWKTTDGGIHWKPVFDEQTAQSIGSIAIAPSDSNVVWVGTGEPFIRSNVSLGNGIYKSTDAGKTWTHMGLEKSGRIARVVIDPRNPDVVFAAALGTCYGPQQERGVYRTTDGGKSWERVLFVDELTGASDLAMDPTNPRILFAVTWQIDIKTWGRKSGGRGGGGQRDMWADPKIPSRIRIGNGGGVLITSTRRKQWNAIRLPNGQIYHVTGDNRVPYYVYGQMQDDGSFRGPSVAPGGFGIP